MKKIIFLILLSIGYLSLWAGNNVDTIYINPNRTTYVIVTGTIATVDIGKKNYAVTLVKENSVLIKPELMVKSGDNTSLLVQFLDRENNYEYYSALLVCTEDSDKNFVYDKRNYYTNKLDKEKNLVENQKKAEEDREKRKIGVIENGPIEIRDVGEIKEDITILLRNIGIDDKNIYLRFEVQNNSTIDYILSSVDISYVKRLKKGLFKKDEYQREPVSIEWGYNQQRRIKGKQSNNVSFALPLYGIKGNDYLQVMFREKNGNRNLEFRVMGKVISKYAKFILLEEEQYIIK